MRCSCWPRLPRALACYSGMRFAAAAALGAPSRDHPILRRRRWRPFVADRQYTVTGPQHAADGILNLAGGRTASAATGAVQAATIRRRIHTPLRFADGYST